MSNKSEKISFVFPVYNEEGNLELLYQQVKEACGQADVDYEMIFVDNGGDDTSLDIIKRLRQRDGRVIYISLSRNFGHQNALFAGMSYCTGAAVITMDADLQHPPSLIPKMIDLWRRGTEVVYTTKKNANLGFVKHFVIKSFYGIISRMSGLQLNFGQSDFRLIDKKVLKVIMGIPEYHKFLRGQVKWVGFKQENISYDVEKRYSGKSKFSYGNLFSFALDGIFAFSRYPLHLLTLIGIAISCASFLYIFLVFLIYTLNILRIPHSLPMPPGWATLTVAILFLGNMQLVAIGVLGEYIGRIYDQTKGRPVFIIREMSAAEE
ncbi:MAG: glycosyltransferase family 2 protein [Candidatus Omnitrophota bacterium]